MYLLILAVIYLAFIGLGSQDALFGSAWPTIQIEMGVPVSYAGIVGMLISSGTITSSLLSARLIKRFGAGRVIAFGLFLSSTVLLSFSFVTAFWMLCLLAFPLGFGGGAVDTTSNNHVALHYTAKHMSWLHCFWGVGAVISPFIMGFALTQGAGWYSGYRIVFSIQIAVAILLLFTLPLWKRQSLDTPEEISKAPTLSLPQIFRVRGVKCVLLGLVVYCGMEFTAMLWASTYLAHHRGVETEIAAGYGGLFFIGLTLGRFISGFIANRVGDKNMVRGGALFAFIGIIAVWIPVTSDLLALIGLVIIGFGSGPIVPALIHSTSSNFGKERAPSIIGVQMASAFTGSTLLAPLFGLVAEHISIGLFPVYMFILATIMLVMIERLNRLVKKDPL
jgi:fucose permease